VIFEKDFLEWIGWGKIFFGEINYCSGINVDILLATSKLILIFLRINYEFVHLWGNCLNSSNDYGSFGWIYTVLKLSILNFGRDWDAEGCVLTFWWIFLTLKLIQKNNNFIKSSYFFKSIKYTKSEIKSLSFFK